MIGAILGDIIGSPFEFDRGDKSKEFELFTDNTVMTIAVADGFLSANLDAKDEIIKANIVRTLEYWGKKYPQAS